MSANFFTIFVLLSFGAAGLDGTPLGWMMTNKLTFDRDNYKETAMVQPASHVLLAMATQQKGETALLNHSPLESKDASTLKPVIAELEATTAAHVTARDDSTLKAVTIELEATTAAPVTARDASTLKPVITESEVTTAAPVTARDASTLKPLIAELEAASADSVRERRSLFWLPFWFRKQPILVRVPDNNHFVYDSFLGKVKREAPNTSETNGSPQSNGSA